jgi:hypothetical protein
LSYGIARDFFGVVLVLPEGAGLDRRSTAGWRVEVRNRKRL